METFEIQINGRAVEVSGKISLLETAKKAGIYIPSLCNHPQLCPAGTCGICAVEIEGEQKLAHACAKKASPGMRVFTDTPKVKAYRKGKLLAILKYHPHTCLTCPLQEGCSRNQCSFNIKENERCCPKLGYCEIQKVANYIGVEKDEAGFVSSNLTILEDHPLFSRNYNFCIGCDRCVRMCRHVWGKEALKMIKLDNGRRIPHSIGPTLAESCARCRV